MNNGILNRQALVFILLASVFSSCSQTNNRTSESPGAIDSTVASSPVTSGDSLLAPGRTAGAVALESDAAAIMKLLGKPDAGDAAMGKSVSTWYNNHDTSSYSFSIFSSRDMGNSDIAVVKQIRVTDPGFKTAGGVGTQSTIEDIRKEFNVQEEQGYKLKQDSIHVYADSSGIAFEVDDRGKCIGVVVYPKGRLHPDTYARFIPDMSR